MKFPLVDVHGEHIIVKAKFEWHLVRRPTLSDSRLVDKGVAVAMGNDQENKLNNNGREMHLHKSSGVCHVRASAISELFPQRIKNQEAMLDHHQGCG